MEYSFKNYTITSPLGVVYTLPLVLIVDADKYGEYFNGEINSLTYIPNLTEITDSLQQLKNKTLESFTFGYEVYAIVCDHEFCRCYNVLKNKGDDWGEPEAVIPIDEVLQLMIDWRNYVIEWEKEYRPS